MEALDRGWAWGGKGIRLKVLSSTEAKTLSWGLDYLDLCILVLLKASKSHS